MRKSSAAVLVNFEDPSRFRNFLNLKKYFKTSTNTSNNSWFTFTSFHNGIVICYRLHRNGHRRGLAPYRHLILCPHYAFISLNSKSLVSNLSDVKENVVVLRIIRVLIANIFSFVRFIFLNFLLRILCMFIHIE